MNRIIAISAGLGVVLLVVVLLVNADRLRASLATKTLTVWFTGSGDDFASGVREGGRVFGASVREFPSAQSIEAALPSNYVPDVVLVRVQGPKLTALQLDDITRLVTTQVKTVVVCESPLTMALPALAMYMTLPGGTSLNRYRQGYWGAAASRIDMEQPIFLSNTVQR